jgi:hypothetical protein
MVRRLVVQADPARESHGWGCWVLAHGPRRGARAEARRGPRCGRETPRECLDRAPPAPSLVRYSRSRNREARGPRVSACPWSSGLVVEGMLIETSCAISFTEALMCKRRKALCYKCGSELYKSIDCWV